MTEHDETALAAYRQVAHYTIDSLERVFDELNEYVTDGSPLSQIYENRREDIYLILRIIRGDYDR